MRRKVQPEILDSLDPADPAARANRRDLVVINRLMGNYRWFATKLRADSTEPASVIELGAGGGELGAHLHRCGIRFSNYTAVDFIPPPINWPPQAQWHIGDLLDFPFPSTAEILLANLILHHFSEEELAHTGAKIQTSGIQRIYASEPCRRSIHRWQLRAGRLIGFSPVTLHDGCVSIEGGFRHDELPKLLGLSPEKWAWTTGTTALGAYRFAASRRKAPKQ